LAEKTRPAPVCLLLSRIWPFFADQYGPRMASVGCPKLALNFPSLLQLLPLLLLPKHPLLLTCTTSQMRMLSFSTHNTFFYPSINHHLPWDVCPKIGLQWLILGRPLWLGLHSPLSGAPPFG
jgi:hypothetical protein